MFRTTKGHLAFSFFYYRLTIAADAKIELLTRANIS